MPRRAWLTGDIPATGDFICRRLIIPNDLGLIMAVNGALVELTREWNWETFGPLPASGAAALMSQLYEDYVASDVCMIGVVVPYATNSPPPGCLPCDGSSHQRGDYPRLYDQLAPQLITGPDTFVTPDLRGVFVLGATDPDYPAFTAGGAATHQLTSAEMPAHAHTTQPHGHTAQPHAHSESIAVPALINGGIEAPASAAVPAAGVTGVATVVIDPASVTVDQAGGDQAHNNMPPYIALRYCIVAR